MGDLSLDSPKRDYRNWKAMSLDEKLSEWSKITKSLFNYDCSIAVLGSAALYCDSFFGVASTLAAIGAVGYRSNIANDHQLKSNHLLKLYKKECALFGDESNTPNTENAIKILKVIGPYLPFRQIVQWNCDPKNLPEDFLKVVNSFGVFHSNQEMPLKNQSLEKDCVFKNGESSYTHFKAISHQKRILEQGRHFLYGVNNVVSTACAPVGTLTGYVSKQAGPFFAQYMGQSKTNSVTKGNHSPTLRK